MRYNHHKTYFLILLGILSMGLLILCLAIGYSKCDSHTDKPTDDAPTVVGATTVELSPKDIPNAQENEEPLEIITVDNPSLPTNDEQVEDIDIPDQAIGIFYDRKDYSPLCQPRYLYQKGYYIHMLALGTFNLLLLPSLWLYTLYILWGTPLTIFGIPVCPFSLEIGRLRLVVTSLLFLKLYRYVYERYERLVGERYLQDGYTPEEIQEFEAMKMFLKGLLAKQEDTNA